MSIGLIALAKMENKYLRHWVEYYKCLGFTNIILCDNNNADGESFEEVIADYIESGFVIVENYRNVREPQLKVYAEMYYKYKKTYNWLAFFDCDEYLSLEDGFSNVEDFLSQEKFKEFQGVKINWICYGDNGLVEPNYDIPVTERFTKRANYKEYDAKAKLFLRSNLTQFSFNTPHSVRFANKNNKLCDVNGKAVPTDTIFCPCKNSSTHLKHYITKTIVEYINKIKRGDVLNFMNNMDCRQWLSEFWWFNEKTVEKEQIMNKFLEYMKENKNYKPKNSARKPTNL